MSLTATASSGTKRLSAWQYTIRRLPLLALSFLLAGCPADNVPLEVVGYNHTDRSIGYFSVNGVGTFLMKHSGGGKYTCCITVPPAYKPGMKATVTWTDEAGDNPRSRDIAVPPYGPDDFGLFAVHFLRDGQIKLFVTPYNLGHPNYPLKGDDAKL